MTLYFRNKRHPRVMYILIRMIGAMYCVTLVSCSLTPAQEAKCFSCIKNATVYINDSSKTRCEGHYCGPYQFSYQYWAEAGKPSTIQGLRDFEKCARDKSCSEQTIRGYFRKFKRDCNNDGYIDCLDMAALHRGGPTSCSSDWFFKSRFWLSFNKTSCVVSRDFNEDLKQTPTSADVLSQHHLASRPQPIRASNKNETLTSDCLDCICEALTGCTTLSTKNCDGGVVCGPFAISQSYWKDGRRPGASWTACSRTKECSHVAMKNYMEKYKRDCNGDKLINCEDYAAIHKRGYRDCSNRDLLKENYWIKFLTCRSSHKPSNDVNMVKLGATESSPSDRSSLSSRGNQTPRGPTTLLEQQQATTTSISEFVTRSSIPASSVTSFRPKIVNSNVASTNSGLSTAIISSEQASSNHATVFDHLTSINSLTQQSIEQLPSTATTIFAPIVTSVPPSTTLQVPPSKTTSELTTTNIQTYPQPSAFTTLTPQHIPNRSQVLIAHDSIEAADIVKQERTSVHPTVTIADSQSSIVDSPDYGLAEIPYSALPTQQVHERESFDNVVSGIMTSPDFSKVYPPFPDSTNSVQQQQNQQKQNESSLTPLSRGQNRVATSQTRNSITSSSHSGRINDDVGLSPQQALPSKNLPHLAAESALPVYQVSSVSLDVLAPESGAHNSKAKVSNGVDSSNNNTNPDALNINQLLTGIGINESSKIPSECLECICDASSNCDATVQCISKQRDKNRCGLYMISWNQFQESDISLAVSLTSMASESPATVPTVSTTHEDLDEKFYYDCSTDRNCAERLIHMYIEKHQKDCNGDGKIDCYDIAAIHRVGPDNCSSGRFLSSQYWKDFNICYAADRPTTTISPSPATQTPASADN